MFNCLHGTIIFRSAAILSACTVSVGLLSADEKVSNTTRILLVASQPDHPWATHMYQHECKLLGKCLENVPEVQAITSVGWPRDEAQLADVKAIVFYCKHAGDILLDETRRQQCEHLLREGAGL